MYSESTLRKKAAAAGYSIEKGFNIIIMGQSLQIGMAKGLQDIM